LLTTGSGITSCAWLLEYTDESSTCDAPVSRAPFPESEHAGRRFLNGSSEVALLVARLDQDVVKQWRIAKYESVIKVDPEYLGPDVRSQSMYLFLELQLLGTLAAIAIGFAASSPSADSGAGTRLLRLGAKDGLDLLHTCNTKTSPSIIAALLMSMRGPHLTT